MPEVASLQDAILCVYSTFDNACRCGYGGFGIGCCYYRFAAEEFN